MLFRIAWSGWIGSWLKVKFSLWLEWSGRSVLTNGKRPYCHMLPATGHLACEQALLFGRAKRAARERAGERRGRKGPFPAFASPLARLIFSISPKWRACSQATGHLAWKYKRTSSAAVNVFLLINWQVTWDTEILFTLVMKISCLKK